MEAIKEIKEVIAAPVLGDEHIVDEEKKIARAGTEPISSSEILRLGREMKAVGFDMDGVLFGTSQWRSVRSIGFRPLASFVLRARAFPKREVFFESLRKLHFETNGMSVVHQGVQLPSVLTAWQCGLVSGPDAEQAIANFYEQQKDYSDSEIRVFKAIAHLMLDAHEFVDTRVVLEKGFELLKEMAAWKDPPILFGISNWDAVSFEMLRHRHPEVFSLLKIVVISGEAKVCKPHVCMYEHALEKLRGIVGEDIAPGKILFLDDEQENVNGAGLAGFVAHRYVDDL